MTDGVARRLEPLPIEQWGDDAWAALRSAFPERVLERFAATGDDAAPIPTVLALLLRHPALAGPFLAFNQVLLSRPTLDARWRELMVLRVAWRTRSRYEWVQHVRLAERFAITAAEIDAIAAWSANDRWTPLERALLAATDELIDGYRVDDATWHQLAEHLDEAQLVELVFVVGTYTCLAMALNSFDAQLEAGADTGVAPPFSE